MTQTLRDIQLNLLMTLEGFKICFTPKFIHFIKRKDLLVLSVYSDFVTERPLEYCVAKNVLDIPYGQILDNRTSGGYS